MSGIKDSLDCDVIEHNLKTKIIGKKIIVFDKTASTNNIAAEYGKNKSNNGLAVFAEEQTSGRGRFGNKWLGGRNESILCSILLTEAGCSGELLSLVCAVAVAKAIGIRRARVKWPNDVLISGKKVAGVLVETKKNKQQPVYIIGIGINCHQAKKNFAEEIQSSATSLDIESKSICDRNSIAKRLLIELDHWLGAAVTDEGKVIEKWQQLSIHQGYRTKLIFNGKEFSGTCIGIDPKKGLILQLDGGGRRMFDAAHTSVAK